VTTSHRPLHRRLGAAAIAVALAAVAAGCSDTSPDGNDAAGAAATSTTTAPAYEVTEPFAGDDFYAVPDPLPNAPHGTLIRYEPIDDRAIDGATAYRIMYLSESVAGDPIAVTGMASVPTAEAPDGGRPMITISHGTTGIADECAPSKSSRPGEMTLVSGALGDTYLIAATDYEGLGTPGRHPYLVGESEGRSSIDAIVAAGSLPDAEPGTELGIMGYSQGGHGALWTSQVAADWAPQLEVVGTFSGAPASEIGVILAAASRVKGFAMMVIAGIAEAYPDADLATILTPKGIELLGAVDEGCASDTFNAVGSLDADEVFLPGGSDSAPWNELGPAQNAGSAKTNDAPTLIIHSTGDELVPAFFIDQTVTRMCANGQVVERRDIDAGGHSEAAVDAYGQALEWMQARFAPDPPPPVDSCTDQG